MNKNLSYYKKNIILLLFSVIFFAFSFSFVNLQKDAFAQPEVIVDKYALAVEELSKNVNFNCELEQLYSPNGEIKTVYNFVVPVRFNGEDDIMKSQSSFGKTWAEVMNEMYNSTEKFSVKKYYQTVSNGRLNLESILIFDNGTSLQLSKARSECVNKEKNNGIGYDPNEIVNGLLPRKFITEYQLLNQICAFAKDIIMQNYNLTSDSNGDKKIDSLSIVMQPDPNNYIVGWGDMLWAHSSQIQTSIISFAGQAYNVYIANFRYTNDNGETIEFGNYMLTDMETTENSYTGMPKNNTDIHELGHVLGFPDYYVYDDDNTVVDNDTEAVCFWDIMGYNHLDLPQYPLSYNREKQKWIDAQNITEITSNGRYKIKPVNYEETNNTTLGDRTVAYKILSSQYPNQSIYLEYRKQTSGSFENNGRYVEDGLIVYRVDEGFSAATGYLNMLSPGNFKATPYNVYVFRNNITKSVGSVSASTKNAYAPLNLQNSSMGDGQNYTLNNLNFTACDITWQVYSGNKSQSSYSPADVTEIDSGIAINVVAIDEITGELTFEVQWEEFVDRSLSQESFGDIKLYNELLRLAGKTSIAPLYATDLENTTSLDFHNLSLSSLEGLELMEFVNLESVDCSLNRLSNFEPITKLQTNYPNIKINLAFNNFDVSAIPNNLKTQNIIFGFQNANDLNNAFIFLEANASSTTYISFYSNNYQDVSFNKTADATGLRTAVQLGKSTLSMTPQSDVFTHSVVFEFVIIKAYISPPNALIERNSAMPTLVVEGLETSEYDITRTPADINTSQTTSNYFTVNWQFVYKADITKTNSFVLSFKIVDTTKPIIQLMGENKIEIRRGESISLPDPEVAIFDNGDSVDYNYIQSPTALDRGYWTKVIYKINDDSRVVVAEIDNTMFGNYVIEYSAVDLDGNLSGLVERNVEITADPISRIQMPDENLYNAICDMTNKLYVYENSLYDKLNIVLRNKNIKSIKGLELLMFGQNSKIDLSCNQISSFVEVASLLAKDEITITNLHLNDLTDTAEYQSLQNKQKITLGIQGLDFGVYIKNGNVGENIEFVYFNDDKFSVPQGFYLANDGQNIINSFAKYDFNFTFADFENIVGTVEFGNINFANQSQKLEVYADFDMSLTYNYYDAQSFDVVYYINDVITTLQNVDINQTLGEKTLKIAFSHNDVVLKTITKTYEVVDTTSPEISFVDEDLILYLKLGEQIDIKIIVNDNYDAVEDLVVTQENDYVANTCGIYTFSWYCKDLSGNESQTISKAVYVANITPKDNVVIEYHYDPLPTDIFDFELFELNEYDCEILSGVDTTELGENNVRMIFSHKTSNLVFDVQNTVSVQDNTAPIIYLNGNKNVQQYVKTAFSEPGYSAMDNYDGDITDKIVVEGFVNYNAVGTYTLTYKVVDSNGNVASSVQRVVEVKYLPINQLAVSTVQVANDFLVNTEVALSVVLENADSRYNDLNSVFEWYINGELVHSGYEKIMKFTFDKVGQHEVYVKVINNLIGGDTSTTTSEKFYISVNTESFFEKYGLYLIAGSVVLIILFIIISLVIRRKRKFYF